MSVYVDVGKAMSDGIKFMIAPSKVIVTAGNADGELPLQYIVKAEDKASGAQIYPTPSPIALKTPTGGQYVSVNSLHAFDNEYAYFTWAQFGSQSQDVMMLVDTGASISILPTEFWRELQRGITTQLKTSEGNIEVGNGGRLETDGTVYLPFTLSDYEFHHVFFVCKDSSTAILGNDFIVRNKIHLFMAEGWMNYAGNDIPLFTRHGARQVRKVYLAKTVMIPPMQEVEVPTYMKNYISTSRPRMFEGRQQFR